MRESLRQAIIRVRRAIEDPGNRPDWHRQTLNKHRSEWPTLWAAIDNLMREFCGCIAVPNCRTRDVRPGTGEAVFVPATSSAEPSSLEETLAVLRKLNEFAEHSPICNTRRWREPDYDPMGHCNCGLSKLRKDLPKAIATIEEGAKWKEAYKGAARAASANTKRLNELLDLYGAAQSINPIERIIALGEALLAAREAVANKTVETAKPLLDELRKELSGISEWVWALADRALRRHHAALAYEREAITPNCSQGRAYDRAAREFSDKLGRTSHEQLASALIALRTLKVALDSVKTQDSEVNVLPDGSAFVTVSTSLLANHWSRVPGENEPPAPFRRGTSDVRRSDWAAKITEAGRYAYRATTQNGTVKDLDPDALIQNLVVGMLGFWTPTGERE